MIIMSAIRSRLAAVLASFLIARLVQWGVADLTPDASAELEAWLNHTFDLVLFIGYAVLHPWIQKRLNPTGAFTTEAARRLERVAHVGNNA
jgi:hypothetical protein